VLGKPAGAVIDEDRVRAGGREEEQVEIAVAVGIREGRTGRVAIRGPDARLCGDVFEAPPAETRWEKDVVIVRIGGSQIPVLTGTGHRLPQTISGVL